MTAGTWPVLKPQDSFIYTSRKDFRKHLPNQSFRRQIGRVVKRMSAGVQLCFHHLLPARPLTSGTSRQSQSPSLLLSKSVMLGIRPLQVVGRVKSGNITNCTWVDKYSGSSGEHQHYLGNLFKLMGLSLPNLHHNSPQLPHIPLSTPTRAKKL